MEYPGDMSESETTSTVAGLEALEALQADASELERIEGLLDRFNVFEAIGFVDNEVVHSNFLALLLNIIQEFSPGQTSRRGSFHYLRQPPQYFPHWTPSFHLE